MGEYDDSAILGLEEELRHEKLKNIQQTNQNIRSSIYSDNEINNLVQWQLDLTEEKEKIDHLLRGHIIKRLQDGNEYWAEPHDLKLKPLSDYGVEQLMNIINFYLSRNNILSFYDEEQIRTKMLDIGEELADKIFNEYEYFFYIPTIMDLIKRDYKKIHKMRITFKNNPVLLESFTDELYKQYLFEIEEIRIKNLKNFPMIHQLVTNQIHAAYNRALRGEERESLRKFMHINLSDGIAKKEIGYPASSPKQKFRLTNPSTWNV